MTALTNEYGTIAQRYAYDPWGRRRNPDDATQPDTHTSLIVNRGYTMHEHLDKFGVINMNGRVYDPLTAQFYSPDPYVTFPDNWLNYNRYSYALNNPFRYTDPDGEHPILVAMVVGALVNGFIAGVQMDMSGQGRFLDGFWRGALVGAATGALGSIAPFGTAALGSTLWGAAVGTASNAGMVWASGSNDYSKVWIGTVTGAAGGFLASQEFGNLVKGKGFYTNDQVKTNFELGKYNIDGFDNWQSALLDYMGLEGKYDPNNALFKNASSNNAGAVTDPITGDIFYDDLAFAKTYDNLKFKADHESFHRKNVLSGKFKNIKIDNMVIGEEEWSVWQKNYTRQGLYPQSGVTTENIVNNINSYGNQAGLYETVISMSRQTGLSTIITTKFDTPWWHFIYKIPRRW